MFFHHNIDKILTIILFSKSFFKGIISMHNLKLFLPKLAKVYDDLNNFRLNTTPLIIERIRL